MDFWAALILGSNIVFADISTYKELLSHQTVMGRVPSNKVETVSNLCDASVPRREKLKQLIEKRIGKENFVEKLGFITKHELYSRAAQKPQPVFPSPEQMLFDHEFTKLVKELEGPSDTFVRTIIYSYHERRRRILIGLWQTVTTGMITKAVHKSSEEEKKEEEVKKTLEQHDNIVTQYKELIREQVNSLSCARFFLLSHAASSHLSPPTIDFSGNGAVLQDTQVQQLKEQVSSLSSQNEQMQSTITQQLSTIQQHKDQYNILKLKLGGWTVACSCHCWKFAQGVTYLKCVGVTLGKDNQTQGDGSHVNGLQLEELTQLREQVEELRKQNALLQTQLGDKDALINTMVSIHTTSHWCLECPDFLVHARKTSPLSKSDQHFLQAPVCFTLRWLWDWISTEASCFSSVCL